ncbi:MAG: DUF4870 domain-containing protein [Bdellovibrionota bacterium]
MTENSSEEKDGILSRDEITFAILAHALQVHGFLVAPLIIFLTKRNSRFVSFHALQALLFQLLFTGIFFGSFALFFALMITHLPSQGSHDPPKFFFLFPILWLVTMGGWVITWIIGVVYAVRAGRGEWSPYPVIGKLAARILKIKL